MSRRFSQLNLLAASRGLMLLVRWMLVLVLAADLIGSPFHAHHHDGGPDGYSMQVTHLVADHDADLGHHGADSLLDLHGEDDARFGHALSAHRESSARLPDLGISAGPQWLASLFVFTALLTPHPAEIRVGWQSDGERVHPPSFRTVPPHGRAPPALHV